MEPLVLRGSRGSNLFLIIGSAVFVVIGVLMLDDSDRSGWFVVGFFGLCLLVGLINALPAAAWLRIEEDGFTYASMFRKTSYSWNDVEGFYPRSISGAKMLGVVMSESYRADRPVQQRFAGTTGGALPDTYGMDGEELANLMNERLDQYRERNEPESE